MPHTYTLSIPMTTTHTTSQHAPALPLLSRLLDGCCLGCATAGLALAMHLCADEDKAREADASRATLAPIMRITSYVGDAGDPEARARPVKPVR
jgi:hypothetical protein